MDEDEDETLIALSGLPITSTQRSRQLLNSFLLRRLGERHPSDTSKIYMPVDAQGNSQGYGLPFVQRRFGILMPNRLAIVRYSSPAEANAAIVRHDGSVLDMAHTMVVESAGTSEVLRGLRADGEIVDEQLVRAVVPLSFA